MLPRAGGDGHSGGSGHASFGIQRNHRRLRPLQPTAMALAPDGRMFVCEQGGRLRVIKNGALLATPFLTLTVDSTGERGLLGVAFDPAFATNHFVYVYYTATTPPFTTASAASPPTATSRQPAARSCSSTSNNLSSATNHNGGAIHFGPDGKLYVAVGENANGANAQTLTNLLGKMLRINADGTHPDRQPVLHARPPGANRAIWALGLRNPFTFAFSRERAGCSSTTSARTRGRRSTTASPARTTAGRTTEGPTDRPALRGAALRLQPRAARPRLRDHRRRLLQPADARSSRPTTSATTSSPTTAAAGSAGSTRAPATPSRRLRDRHRRRRSTCR